MAVCGNREGRVEENAVIAEEGLLFDEMVNSRIFNCTHTPNSYQQFTSDHLCVLRVASDFIFAHQPLGFDKTEEVKHVEGVLGLTEDAFDKFRK